MYGAKGSLYWRTRFCCAKHRPLQASIKEYILVLSYHKADFTTLWQYYCLALEACEYKSILQKNRFRHLDHQCSAALFRHQDLYNREIIPDNAGWEMIGHEFEVYQNTDSVSDTVVNPNSDPLFSIRNHQCVSSSYNKVERWVTILHSFIS